MIFLAGLTILKKVRCLGIVGGCGADTVVALHLRNAADYHLPTFGPHGNKQKVILLAGLTIVKKKWCLGMVGGCGADPAVALRLRNAAEYRIPTFRPHGTNLMHS